MCWLLSPAKCSILFCFDCQHVVSVRQAMDSVLFLVGDNSSVNQAIGRRDGALPFVGCAFLQYDLACELRLKQHEALTANSRVLMKRLSTTKDRTVLRSVYCNLFPILQNRNSVVGNVWDVAKLQPHVTSLTFQNLTKLDSARCFCVRAASLMPSNCS